MNTQQKTDVQNLLKDFVSTFNSQKQASAHLKNCSEATIINILHNNWQSVSDDMWRNVGKQVGWSNRGSWEIIETLAFQTCFTYYADAKEYGNVFALIGPAGSGKSCTASWYAKQAKNVFLVECKEYWNRKDFLRKVIASMGKDSSGMRVSEMMEFIVECFLKMDKPILILDEFDKLNDQLIFFFISLYNELKGKCGIVIQGAPFLEKRIKRGKETNKKGYAEIFSRIGRRFIQIPTTSKNEVQQICTANGIADPTSITEIYNDYEFDLRRLERNVHKMRLKDQKKIA
jgi:DNA transposition AAA+ family ATPase